MSRDFEFKIVMDFCSLQEFKEIIVDHSIMNGREVVFQPNDKVRERAKCKEKRRYEIFCNKVGRSHTYRIKTYKPKHHCGRDFRNKNANSKWVSTIVADKLKSSVDVKLTQIIDVVRMKYGIGITLVVA